MKNSLNDKIEKVKALDDKILEILKNREYRTWAWADFRK